jgi:hypothetical protein
MAFKKTVWSPIEEEYLKKHMSTPVSQLCIALAKSRYAIKKKMGEITTGKVVTKKKGQRRSKIGKRPDCNNLFFRSGWEANVYRLLRLDKTIKLIEYEPTDFTFWQFGIKKGTVSYTPDFKVTYGDGSYLWIEIKGGWLKSSDKTKIRRFKKFFPEEFSKLVAVTPGRASKTAQFFVAEGIPIKWFYPDLNKQYKNDVPGWE